MSLLGAGVAVQLLAVLGVTLLPDALDRVHFLAPSGLATALVAVVGAGAGTTRGPQLSLHWQAPTPRDGMAFSVKAGEEVTFELASSSGSICRLDRSASKYRPYSKTTPSCATRIRARKSS